MKNRILKRENLPGFINDLLKTSQVIAPVKKEDFSLYESVEKGEDVYLDFLKPRKSAKEVFFPQNEVMFYFNKRTQKMIEALDKEKETVLFGVPSCDLAGIAAQDKIFASGSYIDVYYLKRRKQTLLVGMGCPEPADTCFCHFFGIDRLASDVADLFFVPLEDRYYIRVNTEKGENLVKHLAEAGSEDEKALKQLEEAPPGFTTKPVPIDEIVKTLGDEFDSAIWDEIAMKCIGCAACTFVCPTCHCFDITDDVKKELGCRVRTWDGCMFPKFTMHASGHNPRTKAGQRMRQRVLHKFSYFMDNQGIVSCTGCGRCIEVCPVNMDIRETLKKLAELVRAPAKK